MIDKSKIVAELVKRKMADGGVLDEIMQPQEESMDFKSFTIDGQSKNKKRDEKIIASEDAGFLDNEMDSPFVEHKDEPIESEEELIKKTLAHVFERVRQKHGS